MASPPNSMHVVFSAECNHALTWQAVGLFASHAALRHPGNITRLLACSDEQLASYRGLGVGPTFVHHNMRFGHPTLIDETGYPSYNKPASVMFWLEAVRPTEEFVALLDTDMLLRAPLDARALGARRGVVVSAEYSYLVGTTTALAERFLDAAQRPLAAQCGGFHIFHRDDIAAIAPLWIEYTRRARAFAHADQEQYLRESFRDWAAASATLDAGERAVRRKQAMWQAEMYGYAFGAAVAGVSHVVRRDTMLYPGYVPHAGILPEILHYGSDFAVEPGPAGGGERLYFNKMTLVDLDLYACADGARGGGRDGDTSRGGFWFLKRPPPPRDAAGAPRSPRDLLCIWTVEALNAAFCGFYRAHCGAAAAALECPAPHPELGALLHRCADTSAECAKFARQGECVSNPAWMLGECARSCDACGARDRRLVAEALGPAHAYGPLARLPDPRAADGWHAHHGRRATAKRRLRELAAEHGCAQRCSFFGVRLRYGAALPQVSDAGECADAAAAAAPAAALPHRLSGVVGLAEFGAPLRCLRLSGPLRLGGRGCDARGDTRLRGGIVLVERGGCSFARKARRAQEAGALAALVYDGGAADPLVAITMSDSDGADGAAVTIPVLNLPRASGERLVRALREANVEATAAAAEAAAAGEEGGVCGASGDLLVSIEGLEVETEGGDAGGGGDWDAATVQLVERCAVGVPTRGVSALPDGDAYPHAGALPMRPCARFDRVFPFEPWELDDADWDVLGC